MNIKILNVWIPNIDEIQTFTHSVFRQKFVRLIQTEFAFGSVKFNLVWLHVLYSYRPNVFEPHQTVLNAFGLNGSSVSKWQKIKRLETEQRANVRNRNYVVRYSNVHCILVWKPNSKKSGFQTFTVFYTLKILPFPRCHFCTHKYT